MPRSRIRKIVSVVIIGSIVQFSPASVAYSFENKVLLKLPWIEQKTPAECGRAILASLIADREDTVEDAYMLLRQPADKEHGYSLTEFREQAARHKLILVNLAPQGSAQRGDCTFAPRIAAYYRTLRATISSGYPIVAVVMLESTSAHYVLLTGIQDEKFKIHDPLRNTDVWKTVSELSSMMCPLGYISFKAMRPGVKWKTLK